MTHGRRTCRRGQPCQPRTLQEALYCVIHHSEIDASTIAARIGVRVGYLHDAANPDRDELQFQARLLIPVMAATGNLMPLRFLAAEFHAAVVELPAAGTDDVDIRQTFMAAVRELGEDAAAIEAVLGDGRVTADEARRVRREVSETIDALVKVQALIDAKVQRSPRAVRPA